MDIGGKRRSAPSIPDCSWYHIYNIVQKKTGKVKDLASCFRKNSNSLLQAFAEDGFYTGRFYSDILELTESCGVLELTESRMKINFDHKANKCLHYGLKCAILGILLGDSLENENLWR